MNKKAIAAFAAGATLLAGFAMATPAFAGAKTDAANHTLEVLTANKDLRTYMKSLAEANKQLIKDNAALATATVKASTSKAKAEAAKKASDAADQKVKDAEKAYNDALEKKYGTEGAKDQNNQNTFKASDEGKKLQKAIDDAKTDKDKATYTYQERGAHGVTTKKDTPANAYTALQGYADADEMLRAGAEAAVESTKQLVEQAKANVKMQQEIINQLNGVTPDSTKPDQTKPDQTKPDQTKPDQTKPDQTKPVQTADPSKSAASAELMRTQVVLAEADATNKDAQEKFVKAKADFEAAKTQMAALDAQVKSAADREEALRVAGKTDTDAYKAAVIDLKAAQSRANAYRTHEYADAEKDFVEKSGKALLAATAYNAALVNYRAAYNKAVEVEASAVKGFADPNTLNPVSTDFPAAPAAAKAEAKKVEAKAEAKAQAAAPAAVAGKAAAKGELAKGGNGHGKAGEKLGNAGVGVALTALAASMLAGMGAAVRKMRH